MKKRLAACAAAAALSAASGCGTVMNLTEKQSPTAGMSTSSKPRSPYGGVGYDLDMSQWLLLAGPIGWAGSAFLIADTPLSAVADTVTLPYVLKARDQERQTEKANIQDREHPPAEPVTPAEFGAPSTSTHR